MEKLEIFTERGVSLDCVSWNRVILLHGPPGNGKTSACHALGRCWLVHYTPFMCSLHINHLPCQRFKVILLIRCCFSNIINILSNDNDTAAAQKLAIRYTGLVQSDNRYEYEGAKLVEIRTKSLLSRWFAESGKLVDSLFSNVLQMLEDERMFVFLLIGKYRTRFKIPIISTKTHKTSYTSTMLIANTSFTTSSTDACCLYNGVI